MSRRNSREGKARRRAERDAGRPVAPPPVLASEEIPCPCGCGKMALLEYRQPSSWDEVDAVLGQDPPPGHGQIHYLEDLDP